jgi:hypothetical protein
VLLGSQVALRACGVVLGDLEFNRAHTTCAIVSPLKIQHRTSYQRQDRADATKAQQTRPLQSKVQPAGSSSSWRKPHPFDCDEPMIGKNDIFFRFIP